MKVPIIVAIAWIIIGIVLDVFVTAKEGYMSVLNPGEFEDCLDLEEHIQIILLWPGIAVNRVRLEVIKKLCKNMESKDKYEEYSGCENCKHKPKEETEACSVIKRCPMWERKK